MVEVTIGFKGLNKMIFSFLKLTKELMKMQKLNQKIQIKLMSAAILFRMMNYL